MFNESTAIPAAPIETASSVGILRPYARSVNAKYHDSAKV